jgi:hypothetical protein
VEKAMKALKYGLAALLWLAAASAPLAGGTDDMTADEKSDAPVAQADERQQGEGAASAEPEASSGESQQADQQFVNEIWTNP